VFTFDVAEVIHLRFQQVKVSCFGVDAKQQPLPSCSTIFCGLVVLQGQTVAKVPAVQSIVCGQEFDEKLERIP